jgi:hypothetical protein
VTEVAEIRKQKLAQLEREYEGQSGLVKATGYAQAYLSNLKRPGFPFGEKTARKIEKKLGLPYMWMDGIETKDLKVDEIQRQIDAILDSVPEHLRAQVLRGLSKE